MKYIVWLVVLGGGMAAVSAYLTAETPAGQMRYEQVVRQNPDRPEVGI